MRRQEQSTPSSSQFTKLADAIAGRSVRDRIKKCSSGATTLDRARLCYDANKLREGKEYNECWKALLEKGHSLITDDMRSLTGGHTVATVNRTVWRQVARIFAFKTAMNPAQDVFTATKEANARLIKGFASANSVDSYFYFAKSNWSVIEWIYALNQEGDKPQLAVVETYLAAFIQGLPRSIVNKVTLAKAVKQRKGRVFSMEMAKNLANDLLESRPAQPMQQAQANMARRPTKPATDFATGFRNTNNQQMESPRRLAPMFATGATTADEDETAERDNEAQWEAEQARMDRDIDDHQDAPAFYADRAQQRPCGYYARGTCAKGESCPMSHATPKPKLQGVCFDYAKGECRRGNVCRFAHSRTNVNSRLQHDDRRSTAERPRGLKRSAPVNALCYRCGDSGHFLQNCPRMCAECGEPPNTWCKDTCSKGIKVLNAWKKSRHQPQSGLFRRGQERETTG